MLEKEYAYYQKNKADILKSHRGMFIVIKDEEIQGVFDTEKEAYDFAISKFELGTFLIQQCLPTEEEVVQTFHTRVVFSGGQDNGN